MRKLTYLVAALMLSGTTATFTGCLDNDEPAGISTLRGAKAELLKAQASLESAKAAEMTAQAAWTQAKADLEQQAVEAQKIKNQDAQIRLELTKLEVALAEAKNEAEKARLKAEIADSNAKLADLERTQADLQAKHEASMIDLKAKMAMAQLAYDTLLKDIKAAQLVVDGSVNITYKNESIVFGDFLGQISGQLEAAKNAYLGKGGTMQDLAEANEELAYVNLSFNADKEMKKLQRVIAKKEANVAKAKAEQETVLNTVGDGSSLDTWAAKFKEIEVKLEANKAATLPLEVQKEENTTAVTAKQLEADLITSSRVGSKKYKLQIAYDKADKSFSIEVDPKIREEYFGTGSSETALHVENATYTSLKYSVKNVISIINSKDYILADNELATAKVELVGLQSHETQAKSIYAADLALWEKSKTAYNDAAKAYGYLDGKGSTIYKETKAAIAKFEAIKKPVMADTTAVAVALGNYLTLRAPFDGYIKTYLSGVTLIDARTTMNKDITSTQFANAMIFGGGLISFLGTDTRDQRGAWDAFAKASEKAFGTAYNNPRQVAYTDADAKEALDQNVDITNWGSFGAQYLATAAVKTLNSKVECRDAWIALMKSLENELAVIAKAEADHANAVKALEAEAAPIYLEIEKLYDAQSQLDIQLEKLKGEATGYTKALKVITDYLKNGLNSSEGVKAEVERLKAECLDKLNLAEDALSDAKIALKQFEAGYAAGDASTMTELVTTQAKKAVAEAEAANKEAKAKFDELTAKYKEVMDIYLAK